MFASEADIKVLLDKWVDCSLPEAEWTHGAHIATCSYVSCYETLPESYLFMKNGLIRFNDSKGVPNSDTRGYHETLTRFWCGLLFYEIHESGFTSAYTAARAMLEKYGKSSRAERDYYSFDVLKSTQARRNWMLPDRPGSVPIRAFEAFVTSTSLK